MPYPGVMQGGQQTVGKIQPHQQIMFQFHCNPQGKGAEKHKTGLLEHRTGNNLSIIPNKLNPIGKDPTSTGILEGREVLERKKRDQQARYPRFGITAVHLEVG